MFFTAIPRLQGLTTKTAMAGKASREGDGDLLNAERAEFIESRDRAMTYRLLDRDGLISGRFKWTCP